jgi:chemotaxis signal transduction protein
MKEQDDIRLALLLFSVCGVHFAVDTDQVAEMVEFNGLKSEDLFWFHEEIGFGNRSVAYYAPTIVTIKTVGSDSYRVIIDSMEDIADCSKDDISLLPPLIEPFALRKGIWGVLSRKGRMIFLLDFYRLKNEINRYGWNSGI